jgi:hypothetical protein
MGLARAAKAASCPPERRDVVQELVSKMGRRRAMIFLGVLGVSIAVLFLASGLLLARTNRTSGSRADRRVGIRDG